MTPSELKHAVETTGRETHFFSRNNMKFAGDKMSNYGVRKTKIKTNYNELDEWVGANGGVEIEVWELYRKKPVKAGLKSSCYFDCVSFRQVHEAK